MAFWAGDGEQEALATAAGRITLRQLRLKLWSNEQRFIGHYISMYCRECGQWGA